MIAGISFRVHKGIILLCTAIFLFSFGKKEVLQKGIKESVQGGGEALRSNVLFHQGTTLHYMERAKAGAVVLFFIHGAPGSWSAFKHYLFAERLAGDFHIVSVDRPGHGRTSSSPSAYASLPTQSKILGALLEKYGHRKVVLVGHSYGGSVALRMALDYPDSIHGLLLISSPLSSFHSKHRSWRYAVRFPLISWLVPRGLFTTNEEMISLSGDLLEIERLYEQILMPIYVLHGSRDILVSVKEVIYFEKMFSMKDLHVRVLDGVNHFIPWTHKSEVLDGIYYLRDKLLK